jgi:hypothetical protein
MTDKNNANNDPLSDALGINPLPASISVNNLIAEAHNDSARTDFESARSNIYQVIETTNEAIFKLSQIADSSQHPRAFEVLAKLMDSAVNANKELLQLQTKIRELNAIDSPTNAQAKNITNNLFVGSTAELQKVIADMKNTNND